MSSSFFAAIEHPDGHAEDVELDLDCEVPETERRRLGASSSVLEAFLGRVGPQIERLVKREAALLPSGTRLRLTGVGEYEIGDLSRARRVAQRYLERRSHGRGERR